MFTHVRVDLDLLEGIVKQVRKYFVGFTDLIMQYKLFVCLCEIVTNIVHFIFQISTNARLNRVRTEAPVKMVSTAINVHVCLDLMGKIVKTVSISMLNLTSVNFGCDYIPFSLLSTCLSLSSHLPLCVVSCFVPTPTNMASSFIKRTSFC